MKLTDYIEKIIQQMLYEHDGIAQIQRNELADQVGCVPSQINYVITSRFTPEQGYIIESRRGGGGFIKIIKQDLSDVDTIAYLLNNIGETIEENVCRSIITNLHTDGLLSTKEAKIILSALTDQALKELPKESRAKMRARLLKVMLLNCI